MLESTKWYSMAELNKNRRKQKAAAKSAAIFTRQRPNLLLLLLGQANEQKRENRLTTNNAYGNLQFGNQLGAMPNHNYK